ncbi:MAG: septum formation initiator family protein [Alphaproteobacteria bacterium]|nr:septum formation initiator family protein [Alphaproteobacteria bacterium]
MYHTITGQRGIMSLVSISDNLDELKQELEQVRFERIMLEHKVKLMNSDSLDLDLVEQQAKQILGVADPREHVIIVK